MFVLLRKIKFLILIILIALKKKLFLEREKVSKSSLVK